MGYVARWAYRFHDYGGAGGVGFRQAGGGFCIFAGTLVTTPMRSISDPRRGGCSAFVAPTFAAVSLAVVAGILAGDVVPYMPPCRAACKPIIDSLTDAESP